MRKKNFPLAKRGPLSSIINQQSGAATVEFAFALIALMGFFAIYMLFVQVFIAHERAIFAGFITARTYAVKGEPPAFAAAVAANPAATVDISGNIVEIEHHVLIPAGLDRFLTKGRFTIIHRSPAIREPQIKDDNPFPY